MYSEEEKRKAVELYLKYGKKAATVIRELGYPNRLSLRQWFYEYRDNGGNFKPHVWKSRNSSYSEEQIQTAVQFYIEHGKSLVYTCRTLGLPNRPQTLGQWIKKYASSEKQVFNRSHDPISYPQEVKETAGYDLCTRDGAAKEVAIKYGAHGPSLYYWKNQMLGEDNEMKKKPCSSDDIEALRKEAEELRKEVKKLRIEHDVLLKAAELLKKGKGINQKTLTNKEKAMVIDALRERHSLKDLLQILTMAKSSYCYQVAAIRKDKYSDLKVEIRDIFKENNHCYGYRRIHQHLRNSGSVLSEKVIRRLMHELGLHVSKAMIRKYNSYKGEITPAVENLVKRNFHAAGPNELWLTDITEFHIPSGKVYLSPIIDCYDGMVVSWTIGTSPSSDLTNQMLLGALGTIDDEKPILHSDRGFHYRTNQWIEIVDTYGLTRSMSKKACSPDNSACEGFFGRLKNEMFYNRKWIGVSIEEFCNLLNKYIYWYNEKRIKMSLGGRSPLEYRKSLGVAS